jgi:hypothetical protein
MLQYLPSTTAAAAVCVALHTLALPCWVRAGRPPPAG